MKNVSRSVARVEMPALSASGRFCTVARMRRPSEVNFRPAASAANAAIDSTRMNSRDRGKANPRTSTGPDSHAGAGTSTPAVPNTSRASCCSTSATPHVTSSVSSGRWYMRRSSVTSSSTPSRPATTKATGSDTSSDSPALPRTWLVT